MKSILVTCLKDEINLIQASHIINSIRVDQPHAEVSVLTFKDLEASSKTLCGASETYFIDRFKIEHLKSGALYSDAFALNTLAENLSGILDKKWDQVINFSNDDISAYIAPMLDAEIVSGSRVSELGNATTSDKWASYHNYYGALDKNAPIDQLTCSHHSAGIPYAKEGAKIGINQDFTMIANQNFSRIRASKGGAEAIIVGICLSASKEDVLYDVELLSEIIETLESSAEYKTVLLLKGDQRERALSDELNHRFENSLISINMDITAMSSVMANLDFLITKPNVVCALADAMDTRIIETLSPAEAAIAVNEGNFAIRELNFNQTADDIVFLLNQENGTILPMASKNSENKVFARVKDDLGMFHTLIRGPIELDKELGYHVARCYHYALLGYPVDQNLLGHLRENTSGEELRAFSSNAKEEITSVVKALLATLRSLQSIKQSQKNAPKFVQYLDLLMSFGKQKNIAQAAVSVFEASVENIAFTSAEKNMEAIEKSLFNLKGDLQTLTKILESLLSEKSPEAQKEL